MKIFVNLPVKNLKRSIEFFTQLGFTFNAQFTDDHATSMVISEHIYAMLMTEERFRSFMKKQVCDTKTHAETILALGVDSRKEVDVLVDKALAAGGQTSNEPADHGFMYVRSFQDIDGHLWEIAYVDPSAVNP